MRRRCLALGLALGAAPALAQPAGRAPAPPRPAANYCAAQVDSVAAPDSLLRPPAPLVPAPSPLRGLYVNRWAALGERMWQLIDVAKSTEVNALVIDVKDDRGLVLYRSRVPLAREIGAHTVRPMRRERVRAVLDSMRTYRIYPIARIVVAKDPILADAKRDWAIRR